MASIITRRGDDGMTDLADGGRVAKDSLRIEACGTVDETNAFIGAALGLGSDPILTRRLLHVQDLLFVAGAELAHAAPASSGRRIGAEELTRIERWTDQLMAEGPPLKLFVLPGAPGSPAAGLLHVARTVCRRAERAVVRLSRTEQVSTSLRVFLNRLSDFLFACARYQAHRDGAVDTVWHMGLQSVIDREGRPVDPPD
jgi:cob(I)alamin adenosyltransferase